MAIVSNIHIGLPAWTPNTAYALGQRVSNNGIAYQAIAPGTSLNRSFSAYGTSGYSQGAYGGFTAGVGPIGSATSIVDGTVTWQYLSPVDFASLTSWAAAIPATLTQPVVGLIWNDGQITTTVGTALLQLSGHTTSAANTITLQPAPGEGCRDGLASQTTPFNYNAANGVSFLLPSGVGNTSYVNITDSNVIIQGLQFQDPFATSASSIIGGTGTVSLQDCIFDGYGQAGHFIVQGAGAVVNSLIVDRQAAGGTGGAISLANTGGAVVNCTLISVNGNTAGQTIRASGGVALTVRNSAIFDYSTLASGTSVAFDHCASSTASITGGTAVGSNVLSCTAVNQFVSPTNDFRLIAGADCTENGVVDQANLPAADDVSGDHRPYGISWDIGAWESRATGSIPLALWADPPSLGLALTADPALRLMTDGAVNRAANALVGLAALAVVGLAGQSDQAVAAASILPLSVRTGIAGQRVLVSGQNTLGIAPAVQMGQQTLASARVSFNPMQVVASGALYRLAAAAVTIPRLVTIAGVSQQNPLVGISGLPDIVGSAGSTIITGAAGQITLFSLSAAIVVANPLRASAAVTLPALRSVAFLSKFGATDALATILRMAAVGQMSSATFATGRTTLPPLTPAASAIVRRAATGLITLPAIRAASVGSSVTQASAINTILDWHVVTQFAGIALGQARIDLTALGQANQFNNAAGRTTIDGVLAGTVPQQLLQADATVPLTLLADGTGLPLCADIPQLNAVQFTATAGTAMLPTFAAGSSVAVQELRLSATNAIPTLTAVVTATLRTPAAGLGQIPAVTAISLLFQQAMLAVSTIDLRTAAAADQTALAAGSATIDWRVAATLGKMVLATARASLPVVSSSGAAQQRSLAGVTVSFPSLACSATVVRQIAAAATVTLPVLRAAASCNLAVLASGGGLLQLSCAATASIARVAVERTIVFEFATRGRADFNQNASANVTLPLTAQGQAIVSRTATGQAVVPTLRAAGTMLYSTVATAAGMLPPIRAQGTATFRNAASAAVTVPLLAAQGQAVNYNNQAAATTTIQVIFVGRADQYKPITAVGTLYLSFGPQAKIYTSPPGYVSGDAVVYWSD